jgi:hypothetical protein
LQGGKNNFLTDHAKGGGRISNRLRLLYVQALYALRGAFKAGAADQALEKLLSCFQIRLLGFQVPYVVKAWPEGNTAHLSAESATYCRIFTEGILGIVPTGFQAFSMRPFAFGME